MVANAHQNNLFAKKLMYSFTWILPITKAPGQTVFEVLSLKELLNIHYVSACLHRHIRGPFNKMNPLEAALAIQFTLRSIIFWNWPFPCAKLLTVIDIH